MNDLSHEEGGSMIAHLRRQLSDLRTALHLANGGAKAWQEVARQIELDRDALRHQVKVASLEVVDMRRRLAELEGMIEAARD